MHADITQWMQQAARVPLLTAAQEINLAERIQRWQSTENPSPSVIRSGKKAREKLVAANLRLVASLVLKLQYRINRAVCIDTEDLLQAGSVGLTIAADKFDHTRGYKFSTYAYFWIRQSVNNHLQSQGNPIRVSPTADAIRYKYRHKPVEQSMASFAAEIGKSEKSVAEYIERMAAVEKVISADTLVPNSNQDGGLTRHIDLIPDPNSDLERDVLNNRMKELIEDLREISPDVVNVIERVHINGKRKVDVLEEMGFKRTYIENATVALRRNLEQAISTEVFDLLNS